MIHATSAHSLLAKSELCLRTRGGTIILCTGKEEDRSFITSDHVVHNINFVHSHFDTLAKVVSARLLHYKHSPPAIYVYTVRSYFEAM